MRVYAKYLGFTALTGLIVSGIAYAATQSVTANATFDSALTLTKNADINFGLLKAATSGTYVISTAGVITPSGGGVVVGGTPVAGSVTITGSATQTVAISTSGYTADAGVTPSAATCNYNGSPIANCDTGGTGLAAPTGSGKTLLLGVQIVADGTQTAGSTAAPTFVVTVVYG
jgi:Domain of unknown function (DUF4402)